MKRITKKQWDRMTIKERKIFLCEDVIARLQLGKLKASRGGYVVDDYDEDYEKVNFTKWFIKEDIESITNYCTVCAKGALFLTHFDYFDNFEPSTDDRIEYDSCDISNESTITQLSDVFTRSELAIIEAAFEGEIIDDYGINRYIHEKGYQTIQEYEDIMDALNNLIETFYDDFDNDTDRLLAIMQNIIDNDGNFDPSVRYSIEEVTYYE